jgi:hypothetical protein
MQNTIFVTFPLRSRPPQWCIVDKWFTMQINSSDPTTRELEATVYNTDGDIVSDILQSDSVSDKDPRKLTATIDAAHKATFRLKFVNGSKGNLILIFYNK